MASTSSDVSATTAPPDDTVELGPLLRRWWALMLIGGIVGAALGVGAVQALDPVHEVTVEVLVGPVVPDSDVLEGSADLARTYGEVVESRGVTTDAAREAGVDPGDVEVAAFAGRGSSTLAITVRTPSPSATTEVAGNVVDRLVDIVEEARAGVADGSAGPALQDLPGIELAELYPSGSTVVVIDDGDGGVTDQSLGSPVGAVAGALAGMFLVAVVVLGLEQRRRMPVATSSARDLGVLPAPPRLRDLTRHSVSIASTPEAVRAADRIATQLLSSGGALPVLLAASRHARPRHCASALVLLAAATEPPPVIVDPWGGLGRALGAAGMLRGPLQDLFVGERLVARLVVPSRSDLVAVARAGSARSYCAALTSGHESVIVYVPADDRQVMWEAWADAATHVLVLAVPRDLRGGLDDVLVGVRELERPVIGFVRLRRRWIRGGATDVRLGPAPEARAVSRTERATSSS